MKVEAIFAGSEELQSKAGKLYSKASFILGGGAVICSFVPDGLDLSTFVLGSRVTVHFSIRAGKFNAPEFHIERVE